VEPEKNHAGRQLDDVQVDKTFTDKASGKDVKRPNYKLPLITCARVTRWSFIVSTG
jgi:hypothetical protein